MTRRCSRPLALLYTFYLYGSNAVYDYLPVGYIQLLKPGQAIGVYVLLALAGKGMSLIGPLFTVEAIAQVCILDVPLTGRPPE